MRRIGRYEVRRNLSRGTTPLIEAADLVLNRRVMLRTLAHELAADPERRTRFLDAAMLAARLSSPRTAQVLDLGDDGGDPYVVMEFPEGATLRSLMDAPDAHTVDFRVGVMGQLCEALDHAHRHGVPQLGLRPSGIFVTDAGGVCVIPFGTIPIHGSRGTLATLSLEEIAYLAPEIVEGRVPDRRADVFTLGVIAYELMARRRPFLGANIPTLLQQLVSECADAAPLPRTGYSPFLESVILKALARNPAERYGEAEAMLADIQGLACQASDSADAAAAFAEVVPIKRPARSTDTQELRAEALSRAVEGRFDEAQALADRLDACHPDDPRNALLRTYLTEERETEALLDVAQRLVAQGDYRNARAAAAEVLTLDPTRARARVLVRQLDRILTERRRAEADPTARPFNFV